MPYKSNQVAVVIPAHNEAKSIADVVTGLRSLSLDNQYLVDKIIVCDNASSDGTGEIAQQSGATTCTEFRKGYGFACQRALDHLRHISSVKPDIVVFVDGDSSVDPKELIPMLDKVLDDHDLVVGNRVNELQEADALGAHQRMGNRVASALIRWIWRVQVNDLGPFRAIRYQSLQLLNMQDQRFGWTVEMQVKAIQADLRYAEVAVSTKKRVGKSKISGTVRGTIGAFFGIFGKIASLYLHQARFQLRVKRERKVAENRFNEPHHPPL